MRSVIRVIGEPLSRIPVRHACGHFELRLTRWTAFMPSPEDRAEGEKSKARGYLVAGSACTQCAPQGRPVSPNYPDLAAAQAAAK